MAVFYCQKNPLRGTASALSEFSAQARGPVLLSPFLFQSRSPSSLASERPSNPGGVAGTPSMASCLLTLPVSLLFLFQFKIYSLQRFPAPPPPPKKMFWVRWWVLITLALWTLWRENRKLGVSLSSQWGSVLVKAKVQQKNKEDRANHHPQPIIRFYPLPTPRRHMEGVSMGGEKEHLGTRPNESSVAHICILPRVGATRSIVNAGRFQVKHRRDPQTPK